MAKFVKSMAFEGFMEPARFEADIADCEVEGEIPSGIDGAFFRVHPDPQFPAKMGEDIWFNGDGMVSQFRFHNGRVDFKHRWVKTDKWKLEHDAGKALFAHYRNPIDDDASVKGRYRGTANTNVMAHGGKLFALKEDSPPVAMDPETLETIGYWDFGGQMKSPTFTAHPKIDPHTGNMVAFGYAAKGLLTRDVAFYEIDKSGNVVHETWFEAPYYCMMHDWGVTQDYAVFHIVPSISTPERLERRMPHFGFDTTLPVYIGVLPRRGDGKDIRWFKGPNLFASHVMNAFNDGPKIYFDTPVAKNNMFPFFPDVHGKPFNPMEAQSRLTRWSMDMESNDDSFQQERLIELVGEFPRIDDRYATQAYRHGYLLVSDPEKPAEFGRAGLFMNTLAHVDLATGKQQTWWCGPVSSLQEPCFIPKSKDAAEGEGYLVALANRLKEVRSDLLVFEAQRLDEGPIATVRLPLRLRPGLHGNWHTAAELSN
jgi:carotenoid cleavage dioxygenase